jgi:hypothetical protein
MQIPIWESDNTLVWKFVPHFKTGLLPYSRQPTLKIISNKLNAFNTLISLLISFLNSVGSFSSHSPIGLRGLLRG